MQVFQTASEKIESASLAAVTALTSCLSRSVLKSDSEDSLRSFLDLVLKGNLIFRYKMNVIINKTLTEEKQSWCINENMSV